MADVYRGFEPGQPLPSTWPMALQRFLAPLSAQFEVIVKPSDATKLQVPAAAGDGRVAVMIEANPRWNEATVERASPGGSARDLAVWVTGTANSFAAGDPGEVDNTNYSFALAVTETNGSPTGVAIKRKVATAHWDGAKFTGVTPLVASGPQATWPTADQKAALAGTSGSPSNSNRYVTSGDGRLTQAARKVATSAALTVQSGVTQAIDFGNVEHDTGLSASDGAVLYTAPVDGIYRFVVHLLWATPVPAGPVLKLYKNAAVNFVLVITGPSGLPEFSFDVDGWQQLVQEVELAAGDTICAGVSQNTGVAHSITMRSMSASLVCAT